MSRVIEAPSFVDHVELADLTVRYKGRTAVDQVDLTLGAGVHGLLGPNGAGKTTLIRVLATVLQPSSGTVRLLGRPELRGLRRRLGYLPQTFGFYPRFTLREFVEYFAWLKEIPARNVGVAVERAIERVGLGDRRRDRMKTLSGGMLRRAGIAAAIVNDPELLLLDEPTAGLDPEQRVEFRSLLREIGRDSCVVVATHLVEDVAAACIDVCLMADGKLLFSGTPDELVTLGTEAEPGDSPVERGYSAILRTHRRGR
jgi:ABC-2 type transport system ATP-binding protein